MKEETKKRIKTGLFAIGILFILFFFYSFKSGIKGQELSLGTKGGGYNLSAPQKVISFQGKLTEISGIGYYQQGNIVAIEDEAGLITVIDYEKEEITGQYPFAKNGDFEGITVAGERVYVLRSNGKIYDVQDLGQVSQKDKKYKTPFSTLNDLEGISYYEKEKGLLMACKGSTKVFPDVDSGDDERLFYIFDLIKKELRREPAFRLDFAEVRKLTGVNITPKLFRPSGIAVHPLSGDIYIISSTAGMMLVVSPDGTPKWASSLRREQFPQPEGICFSPQGTLFISNEGRGGDMKILVFPYDPQL